MAYLQTYQTIPKEGIAAEVRRYKQAGWQLTQISATFKESYDLLYTLERSYDMLNLRVTLADGEAIESVSEVYPYAYLYENEIKDLFGVKIHGMNLDFNGNLYRTAVKTPFHSKAAEGEVSISNG